jgi:nucleotide-binding universal stress UspA family protein
MTMKSMLLAMEQHEFTDSVLRTALAFARRFGSIIEGVPMQAVVPDYLVAGAFGGVPVATYKPESTETAAELERRFVDFMRTNNVPEAGGGTAGPAYRWRGGEAVSDGFLGSYSRVFDVSVFGRPRTEGSSPRITTLEAALFEGGRAALIAPPVVPREIGRHVMIAWNCSAETARTVALAMPLLEKAERVLVLTVEEGTVPGPSGEELTAHLKLNGVPAVEATVHGGAGKATGEAILAEAASRGCDLIIKGAYTRSRLRQMLFGGATSHILSATELPVFMAH